VLRARYNLLTYSEEFDNAAWIKSNVLTPTTGETAPDGTATAWKIVPNTTNTAHEIYQSGLGKGGSARYTIWAKPAGYNYLAVWNGSGAGALLIINVQTGTVVSAGGTVTNISITADANGFYRIQFTEPLDTFLFLTITNPTDGSNTNYAGNGTDGVIVWHPDLRLANDALNMPAYQRVGAATDYDTNGFLPYLAFDGTDDAMSTAAIDFSGTDKMTVFAGVRKLSDAALSILTEFGTGSGPTGEFNVRAPGSAGATYGAESAGTTYRAVTTTTIYAAPITNVLRASYDISGPLVAISVNGASAVQNTASQGTGNYGNYSLFIGSRNNGSLFFNGRIYSLIVRGAASSASEIAATEAWVNARTGAY
jgi:hypothetical protein